MTSKEDDAAALERVRTRLVNTPDDKLGGVLEKLLPRLINKFPPTTTTNNGIDENLIGIFDHILERVLLKKSLLRNKAWLEILLTASIPRRHEDDDDAVERVSHLKYTLPIIELGAVYCDVSTIQNFIPYLMKILEDVQSILLLQEQNLTTTTTTTTRRRAIEDDDDDDDTVMVDSSIIDTIKDLHQIWERVSWMVIEHIAAQSNIRPILDWNFVGDDWDDLNSPQNLRRIQEYDPTTEEQRAAGQGIFLMLIDFLIFDPLNQGGQDNSRWLFRRQTDTIQQDFDHARRQREAEEQLARQRNNGSIVVARNPRRQPAVWSEEETRYFRALQNCVRTYSINLFSNNNRSSSRSNDDDRKTLLQVITGQIESIITVIPEYKPKPSEMYKFNARKKAKADRIKASATKYRCNVVVGNALMYLLFGHDQAATIVRKNGIEFKRDVFDSKQYRFSKFVKLPPVSNTVAQKIFNFMVKAKIDIPASGSNCDNDDEYTEDFQLFLNFVFELKTVKTIQTEISAEIYENIGASTPPSTCWTVHFIWQTVEALSLENSENSIYRILADRAWDAANELLDQLQDVSLQRFERQRRLASMRNSDDRRIHEHRVKQALGHPFVTGALNARSAAYQLVSKFIKPERLISSSGGRISLDVAVRFLNCIAFDFNDETRIPIQEACRKVTSTYRFFISQNKNDVKETSINQLLLPLLKASISASNLSRENVLQFAEEIVFYFDASLARFVLTWLANDHVPSIAQKATDALSRLQFTNGEGG